MDHKDWIQIGHHAEREHLRLTASQLKTKWPGRFTFKIKTTPTRVDGREKSFSLYLRHR